MEVDPDDPLYEIIQRVEIAGCIEKVDYTEKVCCNAPYKAVGEDETSSYFWDHAKYCIFGSSRL